MLAQQLPRLNDTYFHIITYGTIGCWKFNSDNRDKTFGALIGSLTNQGFSKLNKTLALPQQ